MRGVRAGVRPAAQCRHLPVSRGRPRVRGVPPLRHPLPRLQHPALPRPPQQEQGPGEHRQEVFQVCLNFIK